MNILVKLFPGDEGYSKPSESSHTSKNENKAATGQSSSDTQKKSKTRSTKRGPTSDDHECMLAVLQGFQIGLSTLKSTVEDYVEADERPSGLLEFYGASFHKLMTDESLMSWTVDADDLVKEASDGHEANVKKILRAQPDCIDNQKSDRTALQMASYEGRVQVVKTLLSAGADTQIKDKEGDTALHYAILRDEPHIVKLLLQKGADVNDLNNRGNSPLLVATISGHMECVERLLRHKANPNVQDKRHENTALHEAIEREQHGIAALLIATPATDLALRNIDGLEPLQLAAKLGYKEVAKKIITRAPGTTLSKVDGNAAIHLAAINGHAEMVETLITSGNTDIDMQTYENRTSLHLAADLARTSCVHMLLRHGANVDIVDKYSNTALHLVLLKCSTGPDLEDKDNRVAIACRLIRYGADTDQPNGNDQTAMDIATAAGVEEPLKQAKTANCGAVPVLDKSSVHVGTRCMYCKDREADVKFEPCQHKTVCSYCFDSLGQVKQCGICKQPAKPDADTRMKLVLTEQRGDLVTKIDLHDGLLNHLLQDRIITLEMRDRITLNATNQIQVERLLDHLHKRPACEVEMFIHALFENNQDHIAASILDGLERFN